MFRKELSPLPFISIFLFIVLPLAYLPITQDPELSLRYLVFAFFITGLTSFFLFRSASILFPKIHQIPLALFSGYVLFSLFSITKTINIGDGVYEGSKLLLCLIIIVLLSIANRNNIKFHQNIPLLFSISAFIFSVFSMIQLIPLIKVTLFEGIPFDIGTSIISTLSNKNFLAETLLISLPFSIYCILTLSKKLKYLAVCVTIISLILILVIQSAAVYFALGLTVIAMYFILIIHKKYFRENALYIFLKPRFLIITGSVVICAFLIVVFIFSGKIDYSQLSKKWRAVSIYIQQPDSIFELNNAQNNNSVYDRLFLAKNSLHMASEHPILGNGLANWKILFPKYGMYGNTFMSIGRLRYEHPHNDYLFVLCESGLIGLFFWTTFLISLVVIALKKMKEVVDSKQKILLFFCVAAIFSFMLLSLFSYPKERFFSMMMLLFIAAILINDETNVIIKNNFNTQPVLMICVILLVSISTIHFLRYRSEVYLFKAMHEQKKSNFREMENDLIKAKSKFHILDLTSTPLSWHLGQAYYYQKNHQKAFYNYKKAALENPYHLQVLNDLGALYEEKGNHKVALSYFHRVFSINPDFPDTKSNMVAYYFNTGEVEKAYTLLKKHIYKNSPKWRSDMKIILLSKAEKNVQTNQDTALADLLNKKLSNNPNFLMTVYFEAEKDSISFEEKLSKLSK